MSEDPQTIANFTASLLQQQTPPVLTIILTAFAVELLRRDGHLAPDDMKSDEAVLYMLRLADLMLSPVPAVQLLMAQLSTDARNSVH